jgi:hypothetical protein
MALNHYVALAFKFRSRKAESKVSHRHLIAADRRNHVIKYAKIALLACDNEIAADGPLKTELLVHSPFTKCHRSRPVSSRSSVDGYGGESGSFSHLSDRCDLHGLVSKRSNRER